jgi:hypothetical protein
MTRLEEERQRSLERGRAAELPDHYRPKDLTETKEGPCWIWNSRADGFKEAMCRGRHPNGRAVIVMYLPGGMPLDIYGFPRPDKPDLSHLRFPLPHPTTKAAE